VETEAFQMEGAQCARAHLSWMNRQDESMEEVCLAVGFQQGKECGHTEEA
jgi:hypothetical protein